MFSSLLKYSDTFCAHFFSQETHSLIILGLSFSLRKEIHMYPKRLSTEKPYVWVESGLWWWLHWEKSMFDILDHQFKSKLHCTIKTWLETLGRYPVHLSSHLTYYNAFHSRRNLPLTQWLLSIWVQPCHLVCPETEQAFYMCMGVYHSTLTLHWGGRYRKRRHLEEGWEVEEKNKTKQIP